MARIAGLLSYNEPMRCLGGKLRRGARRLTMWLLAGMTLGSAQVVQPPTFPTAPPLNGTRVPFGTEPDGNPDPALRRAMEESARKRNIERQSKMVADSDRICALAQELNDEINKSAGSSLPVAAAKKMDEIQKLARSVKDRMRSD